MVLKLSLVLDRPAYRAGNLLGAMIEVANVPTSSGADDQVAVELAALDVRCEGSELLDPSWISPRFHEDVPPVVAKTRRIERHIFKTSSLMTPNSGLAPASKQRFYVSMRLPEDLPPSFKGTAVRFSYHMSVVATEVAPSDDGDLSNGNRVTLPPHTVKVFFNVWPPMKLPAKNAFEASAGSFVLSKEFFGDAQVPVVNYTVGTGAEGCSLKVTVISEEDPNFSLEMHQVRSPRMSTEANGRMRRIDSLESNGLSTSTSHIDGGSEVGHDELEESGSSRLHSHVSLDGTYTATPGTAMLPQQLSHRSYNLKIGDLPLVKFSLHSPPQEGPTQPGSTFSGMLDFQASHTEGSEPRPRCVQIIVLLETEECLNPQWLSNTRAPANSLGLPTIRKVYDEHLELTQDTLLTHFMFTIPANAPASFATPLVALRWVLRFELTALYIGKNMDGSRLLANKPKETLSWVLPMQVFPPAPAFKHM